MLARWCSRNWWSLFRPTISSVAWCATVGRTSPAGPKFFAMTFSQLTYRESLRDIDACLHAIPQRLYHMHIRGRVARSTMADADGNRDWHTIEDFGHGVGSPRSVSTSNSPSKQCCKSSLFPSSRKSLSMNFSARIITSISKVLLATRCCYSTYGLTVVSQNSRRKMRERTITLRTWWCGKRPANLRHRRAARTILASGFFFKGPMT